MPTNVNKTPSNLDIDNQDVNTSVSELKNLIESHVTNPAVQKYMIDLLTQLIKQVQSEEYQKGFRDGIKKAIEHTQAMNDLATEVLQESLQKEQE